ncbi:hypothetical protein [Gelidibacter maritimus]|uniref:Glycerophosphoryl diester phosphodiesterase membrane domain-containing protein n=1 Tax=Gelidibacter maritimus TaxID=2761487 RepID=A0A7W2M5Z2_9FLAO|nr:hypothetical protein [Gelidibacter maritimus]MBA6153272.1 hypothetical protein [Gelidibacter maritimus]
MTVSEFKAKVNNAKDLDFGTIINQSIELFKKSWLQGFLMQLFVMIMMLPFMIILYVPFILTLINQSDSGQLDPNLMDGFFAGFSIVYVIFFMAGVLVIAAIQMALHAAFFRILKSLDEGREVKTSDLFYFMKGQYFGKIVLLMLVAILIAIPAGLFFYIPLIYVLVPISFFTIIFAFNPEWSIGDIIGSAFRLGNKKWILTFGLFLVSYVIIMMLTMMTCGLGSFFVASFMYHPTYYIYKGVVGFDQLRELDKIGQGEIF